MSFSETTFGPLALGLRAHRHRRLYTRHSLRRGWITKTLALEVARSLEGGLVQLS